MVGAERRRRGCESFKAQRDLFLTFVELVWTLELELKLKEPVKF